MSPGSESTQQKWIEHDARVRSERIELADLAERWHLPLPWGPYRAVPYSCFKCSARGIVYTWIGHEPLGPDSPPAPRPWTLELKTTRQSGEVKYWTNTCAQCQETLGDYYLYREPNSTGDAAPFANTWSRLIDVPGGRLPWNPVSYLDSADYGFGGLISALAGRGSGFRG